MNHRLSHLPLRSGACLGAALAVLSSIATTGDAVAQTRVINLPGDMCNVLSEAPVNERILSDVRARANFGDILAYVEANCGDLATLLIGPTGSIAAPGGGSPGEGDPDFGGDPDDGGEGDGDGGDDVDTPPDRPDDLGETPVDPGDFPDIDNF
ncbi:hypothetical protein [Paragemmobacter ruber]|uniref:hypothetical protein n=1 Tax=Paragemmobacter ruber TaxID=1985673 RepID=UPI00191C4FE9|nr:hypothetical protein [Rhodobacter ruber]